MINDAKQMPSRGGTVMTARSHTSRRAVLKGIGVGGGLVLGTGTASARGGRPEAEPTFFARLSDNPSVPGHEKASSRAKGRLDLTGGNGLPFRFELSVRGLSSPDSEIRIRSGEGTVWVRLFGPEGSDAIVEGEPDTDIEIDGEIEDPVREDVWRGLEADDGVVDVITGEGQSSEIAGVVRRRPVRGWIQL
ncbi:hypothetical protein [Natronorarus salvus]|uniref:hypothetical protein n=1 Tax=Natronorarus salvus TaxID=3117733 RepID=UPI002F268A4C